MRCWWVIIIAVNLQFLRRLIFASVRNASRGVPSLMSTIFTSGKYIDAEKKPVEIKIEVVVADLSDEQKA